MSTRFKQIIWNITTFWCILLREVVDSQLILFYFSVSSCSVILMLLLVISTVKHKNIIWNKHHQPTTFSPSSAQFVVSTVQQLWDKIIRLLTRVILGYNGSNGGHQPSSTSVMIIVERETKMVQNSEQLKMVTLCGTVSLSWVFKIFHLSFLNIWI